MNLLLPLITCTSNQIPRHLHPHCPFSNAPKESVNNQARTWTCRHICKVFTQQKAAGSHTDTQGCEQECRLKLHTYTHSQPHTAQWLYFRFEKEVELNESYPAVRFPGTGLTSSAASLPSSPSRPLKSQAGLRNPLTLSPPGLRPCRPVLSDLPTANPSVPACHFV